MKLVLFLLVCAACGASNPSVKNTEVGNNNDTITVKLNERFEVKLGAVMASGYSWSILDSTYKSHVVLDSMYTIANSDREGDPEMQVFRFKAIAMGEAQLHFIHIRPWRKTDPPTKEKNYNIIVNKL
jgi:predicted secreted protein